ncbi:MAG: hypothetical protein R2939_04180 [Kofleriaceae bacterium]
MVHLAAAGALALLACQAGTPEAPPGPPPPAPSPAPAGAVEPPPVAAPMPPSMGALPTEAALTADLARICGAVEGAGASDLRGPDRTVAVAQWLGANVASDAGRAFLVEFGQLPDGERADALRTAAQAAGLPGCALAAEWTPSPYARDGPSPPTSPVARSTASGARCQTRSSRPCSP